MKIYCENITLDKLAKKINLLDNYLCDTKNKCIIYSVDGIFKIDENNIKKMIILSDKSIKCKLFGHPLLVEDSKVNYDKTNFIPNEHDSYKYIELNYLLDSKSKLKLIIEGNYEDSSLKKFLPSDFYFETQIEEEIHNSVIRDDLNVFLSLLN